MFPACLPTAASDMTSVRAIAALDWPAAMWARTSRSRGQRCQRVAAAAHELADHLRVDDGAARADPAQCGDELLDVGYPVFEQVADAPAV